METAKIYRLNRERPAASPATPTADTTSPQKPKLLEQVHQAIRTRHYSPRTEESYVHWIKRFIFFHNKRHPVEMGEAEIGRFSFKPRNRLPCQRLYAKPGSERYFVSLPRSSAKGDWLHQRCGSCQEATQTTGGFVTTGGEIPSRHPRSFRLAHGYVDLWSGSPTNGVFGAEG